MGYETPEDDTVDKIAKTGEKHSVSNVKSQGTVVSGEESETDDEEETLKREKDLTKDTARNVIPVKEQQDLVPSVEPKTSPALARRAYTYNSDPHIQLREKVVRFYHQFHTRISGIYTTCAKNLKGVNDSLGKVQDILRKVQVSVERNEDDVKALNEQIKSINTASQFVAPNLKLQREQSV